MALPLETRRQGNSPVIQLMIEKKKHTATFLADERNIYTDKKTL